MKQFTSAIGKADMVAKLASMASANGSVTTKKTVQNVIDTLGNLIGEEIRAGHEFTIPGIARLVVTTRAARDARNPATGETIHLPERQVLKAKLNKRLTDCV